MSRIRAVSLQLNHKPCCTPHAFLASNRASANQGGFSVPCFGRSCSPRPIRQEAPRDSSRNRSGNLLKPLINCGALDAPPIKPTLSRLRFAGHANRLRSGDASVRRPVPGDPIVWRKSCGRVYGLSCRISRCSISDHHVSQPVGGFDAIVKAYPSPASLANQPLPANVTRIRSMRGLRVDVHTPCQQARTRSAIEGRPGGFCPFRWFHSQPLEVDVVTPDEGRRSTPFPYSASVRSAFSSSWRFWEEERGDLWRHHLHGSAQSARSGYPNSSGFRSEPWRVAWRLLIGVGPAPMRFHGRWRHRSGSRGPWNSLADPSSIPPPECS